MLKTEMTRTGFQCWYRNPSRPTQDSFGVAYVDGDETKIVRPDFLFFADVGDGTVVTDIVDPHSIHLADALPKLAGLARYANLHTDVFRRVWAVSEVGGKLRVLDLTNPEVHRALQSAESAKSLYESALAGDFV